MRVTLTVVAGAHQGKVFTFADHDTFLVGRSRRAHFRLPSHDRYFSRIHFLVEINPPVCGLMDMGSRNGTHVNGQRVHSCQLRDGDQIKAGRTVLRVSIEDVAPEREVVPSPAGELAGEADVVAGSTQAVDECDPTRCRACLAPLAALPPSVAPGLPGVCLACQEAIHGLEQHLPGYHLVRELGKGAMGVVYLGLREDNLAARAVKTITPQIASSSVYLERFLREARILRQLQHPNIVGFHEMRETQGKLYFAMDYIRGHDVNHILRHQGPLSVRRAVGLTCQVLSALAYAHERGFVHRDIKPQNLLVVQEGEKEIVKVADFGLARMYQASQLSGLTLSGEIGGTLPFMPPEQITEYREIRPPADQFSAAASLYTMLTGKFIHDLPVEVPRQLVVILHDDPVPIRQRRPDIPAALAKVIHRALAHDPHDRWPDVQAFRQALLNVLGESSPHAPP